MLKNLLEEFKDLFLDSLLGLPLGREVPISTHLIEGAKAVKRPLFHYSLVERKEIVKQVEYLLWWGFVARL